VSRDPRRDRSVRVTAAAITLTGIMANTLIAPALPDIEKELGASGLALGAIVALASLPGIVFAPLVGVLADRFGRRPAVVPCLVVFGAGGVAAMLAPSLGLLLAGRLLQGVGAAGLVNLAVVILGDHFDGFARDRAIGRNSVVLTVGLAVFPVLGGLLTALGGWRLAFAPYVLAFGVAVLAVRTLADERPASHLSWGEQARHSRAYLRDPRVLVMMASGYVAFLLVFGLGITTLPLHLDRVFDLGPSARGLLLGVPALATVLVGWRLGPLVARHGTWTLVLLGFVMYAAAFALLAVAPWTGLVVVAALLWGLGEGGTIPPLQAYAAAIAPAAQRGFVVAVWVGAARAGQATGPLLAGALIGPVGTRGLFAAGAAIAAVWAGLGVVLRPRLSTVARVEPPGTLGL
jgi:MFS transporter, ACDE family, multidrug resistance protein